MKINILLLLLLGFSKMCFSQTVEEELKEVESKFYFHGYPINPLIIKDFFSIRDAPVIVSLDLMTAFHSDRYFDTSKIKSTQVWFTTGGYISYDYVGRTKNGFHVVSAKLNGGGTYTSKAVLFFKIEVNTDFDYNGNKVPQLEMIMKGIYYIKGKYPNITINQNMVKIDEIESSTNVGKDQHYVRTVNLETK